MELRVKSIIKVFMVTLSAGMRLGPYEVISAIGAGGSLEMYRARDTHISRNVAVKILPAQDFGNHLACFLKAKEMNS